MKNLDKYFISINSSLEDAIIKMIKQGVKTLIIEKNKVLLGTLSDGDIRKLILKKIKLKEKIKNYFFKNPKYLKKGYKLSSAKKILVENGYDLIPVIDERKRIVDVITWLDLFNSNQKVIKKSKIKNIPILIMAGGLGTRLQPFTSILPKPLLPFKNKSIIENVIDQFEDYLVKNIYISINFKADLIKAYFKQILKKNKTISFLEESKKLGTCAPINKLKKKFENIIVTNCDSLVDLDFNDLYDFHLKSKSMMTLVSANKKIVIPYGVCRTNTKGRLHSFDEKPSYDYLANIGLYIINKKALNIIPINKKFDMDELIYLMLKKNKKISTFPILNNQWMDVGQADSLKYPHD